jgi:poly(A) polymerase
MNPRDIYDAVSAVVSPVYLVGGSVRDVIMGRACDDFDFTTTHDPDSIEALVRAAGRRPYLVGKKFGTVGFSVEGCKVEVTTFRAESYTEGSRRPHVEFLHDLAEDLGRRDFTINAMAQQAEEVIDLFGGRADIDAGIVRAVGDAAERFGEDPLRMLRAARFASQLGFTVESDTVAAMKPLASRILLVARERWMLELDKLLVGPSAAAAMRLLPETGLLRYLLPELQLQVAYPADSARGERTLFEATLAAVGAAPADPTLRWAALLGDIGTPYAGGYAPGGEVLGDAANDAGVLLGGELVERTAIYLKWSNRRRADVRRLVLERAGSKTGDTGGAEAL